MGLLSNLFKSKPKTTCETPLGLFTLVYSNKFKNTWSNDSAEVSLSVQGSKTEPDTRQLKFLEGWQAELSRLDERITKRFKREFEDAGLTFNFTHWKKKFKIVGVDVMLLIDEEAYWNITFEEVEEPFTHFTLFIEGEKLTDFSIDT